MAQAHYTDFTLYRRLLGQARPYWPHMGGIFLLSLLQSPLALLTPLPLQIAVDSVVGAHRLPGVLALLLPAGATRAPTAILVLAAALFVAVALLSQLQQLSSTVLSTYTGERLLLRFRTQLFGQVQRLSLAYHDTTGTADSTYRIQYDALAIQTIAIDGVIPFVGAAVTLGGMLYVTARLDGQLALVALAVSPVLVLIAQAYKQRLRRQSRAVKKLESSALAVVQEVLGAVRVVKAFGQEEREQARFVNHSSAGMGARIRYAVGQGVFGLLVGLTTALGTAAVIFLGMRHVAAHTLTLGELLLVLGYLAQLYAPLKTIGGKAATLQASLASAERAFALLDAAPDVPERPDAQPLGRAGGAVSFRNVCFAYDTGHPALHDISFEIGAGTRLGIVGTTGAGKTTLVSLLTRFYDPTAGQILLDGVDLRAYKVADLRHQCAIVLQEPVLFSTSIAENIAYGRPGARAHEIIAAAQAANAHDFIMGLPQGYETLVGERGMRLSGGERQRIALARAFLKDAPILILDEPTSSVDVKTEAAIMDAMERLMHGRTTFMIAHRLSTLAACDTRLHIEHGRLVHRSRPVAAPRARGGAGRAGGPPRRGSTPAARLLEALRPLRLSWAARTQRRHDDEQHARGSASRNGNVAAGTPSHGPAAPGSPQTAALPDDKIFDMVSDKTTKAAAAAAMATRPLKPATARPQRRAIVGSAAAFIAKLDQLHRAQIAPGDGAIAAKLDQLYRAQIAARDGEIAAKDELIVEVRRRAERAEQLAARLEQKLADLRAHAEVVETQPLLPAAHPGLLDERGRPDAG